MPEVDAVLKEALALNVDDRAEVATRLLDSLDDLDEAEADRLWAEEAQRRLNGYRNGQARTIDASDIATNAERLFRRT